MTDENSPASDYSIYALKAGDEETSASALFASLQAGEGRFGWSYIETADLHQLQQKIDGSGWESLSGDEKACYQPFLLSFNAGDWVIYVNMPEWGQCAAARVSGPYRWRYEGGDYNHRFPVEADSVFVFDRNDAMVHPALSARLKLQGRRWTIYAWAEFEALLKSHQAGQSCKPRTAQANLGFLTKEIRSNLAEITVKIQRTHPNVDLEALIAETFKNVPRVKEVRWLGGAGDHGADIIVTFEQGLPIAGLLQQGACIVQVKSFVGEHADTQALEDIRRAFQYYPEATMGLIVSTADSRSEHFDRRLEELRDQLGKPVALLIGADVAAFFLRYGSQTPE